MAWTAPRTWVTGEIVTAAMLNTDVRDNLNSLGRDSMFSRNIGTAGGLGERWYWLGLNGEPTFATANPTLGVFTCYPFATPRGITIDRLAFEVTTGGAAGSVGRAGIYQSTSDTNLYTNALVIDGGEFTTTTTGVKAATISVTLEPDIVYWAVSLFGTASPTVRNATAGFSMMLGLPSTLGVAQARWTDRTQAYGALPATFPASPMTTILTSGGPVLVGARYSA